MNILPPARLLQLAVSLTAASLLLPVSGCNWFRGPPDPVTLQPSAFQQSSLVTAVSDPATSDAPSNQPANAPALSDSPNPLAPPRLSAAAPGTLLSSQVREVPPTPTAPRAPFTPDAPAPPIPMAGTYMTIGGVLAEVNGVPIFAARVMKELEPALSARARELEPRPFEAEARGLIDRTLNEFISEELEYASAQRNLGADDRKLADALTTDFRQRLILDAGGSLENAKRIALESGEDFEKMIDRENRRFLIRIYYEKKVRPRVSNATTGDMRRFYRENIDKVFTEQTSATFRLIRVDPARHGGKQPALDRITGLRDRAANGEDFLTLATTANDDNGLARRGGNVGKIDRGSFALEKVEQAVFRTEPGQITEIVEDRGGFFIAKVEALKLGTVRPFEDPAVQRDIREKLFAAEIGRMRLQAREELAKGATIRRDPQMLQTALEMAAQRYPLWRNQG